MSLTLHDVILKPVVTEQAVQQQELHNKYTFRVHPRANKPMIRRAVEELFKVKVKKITTLNVPAKRKGRQRTGRVGFSTAWKKAVVTLRDGDTIELV